METRYPMPWRGLLGSFLFAVLTALLLASISGADATKEAPQAAEKEVRVVAARVNGSPVYEDQVAQQVKVDFRKYKKYRAGPPTPALAKRLRERALEKLIAVELLYQAGRKLKVPNLEKRVDAQLQTSKKRHGSKPSKWTDAEQRESIRRNIYVTEYFKTVGAADPEIPEADIKQYYKEHRKTFSREEYIHVRHILVQVARDASPEAKAAAREKIDEARQEILDGKKFAKVAKKYSEDNLALTGGDLSSIKRGYMPPEFDRVAFALEKHTLSDPVETKYGYHLIEVLDKQPAGVIPYEEVKDFIGKYLKMQAVPKKRDSVIRSLRAQAMVEIVEQK